MSTAEALLSIEQQVQQLASLQDAMAIDEPPDTQYLSSSQELSIDQDLGDAQVNPDIQEHLNTQQHPNTQELPADQDVSNAQVHPVTQAHTNTQDPPHAQSPHNDQDLSNIETTLNAAEDAPGIPENPSTEEPVEQPTDSRDESPIIQDDSTAPELPPLERTPPALLHT
jgi:hypothetical protein